MGISLKKRTEKYQSFFIYKEKVINMKTKFNDFINESNCKVPQDNTDLKIFKQFENSNEIIYRLGNENDIKSIKKITNQLRQELPFVMNVVLMDAISKDELYVADKDGLIVGFIHFHKRKDGWNTVHEIGILKEYQGTGVGKKLFNMIPKPRRLKTTEDNIKANEFYKRQGLKLTGQEQGKKRLLNIWTD